MALYNEFSLIQSLRISSDWEKRGVGVYVPIVRGYFVYIDHETLWYEREYPAENSPQLADEVAHYHALLDGERITEWKSQLESTLLN